MEVRCEWSYRKQTSTSECFGWSYDDIINRLPQVNYIVPIDCYIPKLDCAVNIGLCKVNSFKLEAHLFNFGVVDIDIISIDDYYIDLPINVLGLILGSSTLKLRIYHNDS